MRLWHLITALLRVQSWSSLLQVVALDPIDHKNTIYPHRSGYKGPLIIAPWPPKNWRYCRYETLTLITPLQVVLFFSSLFLVVNLNPKDQKNTTWPHRPYLWGPPFLALCHPKHGRNCRYETFTLNNSIPSGPIFKKSVSGANPEPNGP